jgi:putative membrane protein
MPLLANVAVGFVALLHVVISAAEMFFWKSSAVYRRLDRFNFSQDEANKVAPIVANAGLYNAFIASGLVWSLFATNDSQSLKLFFLSCVVIAGIYGAATLKRTTLVLQTLPALLAASLVWIANKAP